MTGLVERLREIETGAPDFIGDTDPARVRTMWYRNPDGPEAAELIEQLVGALNDAFAGWRYIRQHHGDLYGIGWDRVEQSLAAALAKAQEHHR